jgi:hypothetical protein
MLMGYYSRFFPSGFGVLVLMRASIFAVTDNCVLALNLWRVAGATWHSSSTYAFVT